MKKEHILALTIFFFMSSSVLTVVYAYEQSQKSVVISHIEEDLTGDGNTEIVSVEGVPLDTDEHFTKNNVLKVRFSNETESIKLPAGKSNVSLSDLNYDGSMDLFVSVQPHATIKDTKYYLFSLSNGILEELPVPEKITAKGHFENGYRVRLMLDQTKKEIHLNVIKKKLAYDRLGLYVDGITPETKKVSLGPVHAIEVFTSSDQHEVLKSKQIIYGVSKDDPIGVLSAEWLYKDENWTLLRTGGSEF